MSPEQYAALAQLEQNKTGRKYRGYTNPQSLNQYDGVPEAFAHGVYQAPGDSARMLEGLADYTSLGMASNLFSPSFAEQATLSKYVDNATGVNEMNYDPNNYDGIVSLTNAASLAGSIVGAPENALPIGMVAGQTAKRLGSAVGSDLMRPSMVNQSGMVGFHGSPHKFDSFDHSKMGSGEGAQAYGWGTYIAENPDVAGQYKEMLTESILVDGKGISNLTTDTAERALLDSGFDASKAIDSLTAEAAKYGDSKIDTIRRSHIAKSVAKIEDLKSRGAIQSQEGSLYEVDLPDEKIAQMLDWDKPLSEQSAAIQAAAKGDSVPLTSKGSVLYDKLSSTRDMPPFDNTQMMKSRPDAQKAASNYLNSKGIPGIRYLDGNSRSDGTGTSNFVMFDENDMSILSRNGESLGNKGLLGDKSSRMQRMEDNGLERGWYRGGKEPADAPWYSQDRDYAKSFAKGDFREYALPVEKQGMNTAIPNDILTKVADSAADNGDTSIAKEIRSAITDGEPLSYSELNMWFDNNGSTGVNQHFRHAGVEMVSDGKTAYMVNANRVRDAKKATFDPDKKMMKGINLSLGGLLGVNYLNDKEPQNPDL
jgi:hypothetical protein